MNVKIIGSYKIISQNNWKKIYSPNNRMLHVGKEKVYYINTLTNEILKIGKKLFKWI